MNVCVAVQCLTPVTILDLFHVAAGGRGDGVGGRAVGISRLEFIHMCPTIVYQLDAHLCHPHLHAPCHAETVDGRQHCRTFHGIDTHAPHRRTPGYSPITDPAGKLYGGVQRAWAW